MLGLIAKDYRKAVVVGGSAAQAGFPLANALNNDYGRVARSAAVLTTAANGSDFTFQVDLGAARDVDVVGLLWHNFRPGDQVFISGGSTVERAATGADYANWATPANAVTGATARDELSLFKTLVTLPAIQTWRYWSVLIRVMSTNMTERAQVSRLFIGKGAKFAIGPQKAVLGAKDMNANVTTEVGEQRSQEDGGLIRPVASLSFEYAKESEMSTVLGQYTLGLGVSRPLLICPDLTSLYIQDNTVFGRPEKVTTLESSRYDVWSFEAVATSLGV